MSALALALLLGGCDMGRDVGGEPDGSVGGEDGGDPDAGPGPGLTVTFAYLGADGEPVRGDEEIEFENFKIKSMTMQLHDFKLVGDTAPSGGLRSSSRVLEYPWSSPPSVVFSGAPPGLYSELDFCVDRTYHHEDLPPGFDDVRLSVRVIGEAFLDSGDRDFEYIDDETVRVQLHFSEDVMPGALGTVTVDLDLREWFAVVDWQALATQTDGDDDDQGEDDQGNSGTGGGSRETIIIGLEGDQTTAESMRNSLADSFHVRP